MPRTRNPNAQSRSHHKKPAAPELEAMVDTISDGLNPDAPEAPRAKRQPQKPGPKKVINETQKLIGDGLAVGIRLVAASPDPRKSLTMPEAQSIGHPIVRMLARRIPGWVKPFLPKTKLDPDDAADIEEILATMAKVGLRLVSIVVNDFLEGRERVVVKQPVKAGQPDTSAAAVEWQRMAEQSARAGGFEEDEKPFTPAPVVSPAPNGHNPAFDVLAAADFGFEVV